MESNKARTKVLPGFKWRMDLPYLDDNERQRFKKLRDDDVITVFRTVLCEVCRGEVPKITADATHPTLQAGELVKRFCSKQCWDKVENNEGA